MLFLIAENSGSRKLFFERVKKNLNMCKTMYHGEYLILGDFNIDFKNSTHPDTVELRGLLCKFWLRQIIADYTRVSAKSRTLIDLLFTDIDVVESGVKPYIISDYLPIYIIRKTTWEIRMYERLIRRSYFRYSKERIAEMICADVRWWDFWHLDLSLIISEWHVWIDV